MSAHTATVNLYSFYYLYPAISSFSTIPRQFLCNSLEFLENSLNGPAIFTSLINSFKCANYKNFYLYIHNFLCGLTFGSHNGLEQEAEVQFSMHPYDFLY